MADNDSIPRARILVVDDEQIVLNLVEDTLTDEGYDIITTSSALQAVELAKEHPFDFILTDIRMPEMNGIELVKEIHSIAPTMGVIFMTGYANLDTAKQAIKEGAYDYIMKPFELSEIRQAISRAVEQKESATQATLSQELNKITDLSNLIYATDDLASLLQLSLSFAIVQSGAANGIIFYYDAKAEQIVILKGTKTPSPTPDETRLPLPVDEWNATPDIAEPGVITDESTHPLYGTSVFKEHHQSFCLKNSHDCSRCAIIVPLKRGTQRIGALMLMRKVEDYELRSSDRQLLSFISSQLTISLENLRLLEDSREAYARLEYLQDQTLQLEKMATRGQMSAEIGHELNNYLGVVVANFQLMEHRLRKGVTEGLERFTESIQEHLEKISRFTKGLMDYSSLQKATYKEHDINLLLSRIVEFLRPQKRFREFDVTMETKEDTLVVEIDQGLIEQVLYNLLNNAADASCDAPLKKIEIQTEAVSSQLIRLKISDHGSGIAPDKLEKLFKEKFTTKEHGHGIGLVVCKNIIDKHNGRITVDSQLNQGTTFIIDLPVVHEATGHPVSAEETSETI